MPILDTELVWRPSKLSSDSTPAQNGGAINFTKTIVSGVKNNFLPDVSHTERLAGSVKWRKAFIHVASAALLALQNPRVFLDALSPGQDFHLMYAGTMSDTQDQVAGRPYGIGTLSALLPAGTSEFDILVEDIAVYTALTPFRAGDTIRVADRPSVGVGAGGEEYALVQAVDYKADRVTLTLTQPLDNPYPLAGTIVSAVLNAADTIASFDNVQKTVAGSGNFSGANAVTVNNKGTPEQLWTLTFTSPTSYSVTGDTINGGAVVANGLTNTDLSIANPDIAGSNYLTIKATAFSGVFQAGDTVRFSTHLAGIPYWIRREIPAGTLSVANDFASAAIQAESA